MLDQTLFREHLERVKSGVSARYSLQDIPGWIEKNTFIKGSNYSFKGHEFQEYIIRSEEQEVNTQKCSQIGLSEIMARWVMSVAYNFPAFSTIVTFPYSGDASNFARTRVDPFIASSALLRDAMSPDLDNSEIKQIRESFVYFRGTNGTTAAISIPADCIVSDEVDRSNKDILTQYTSRLTHSPYKWRRNFSTPTVKGRGIDLLMQGSRRFRSLCKCNHCNHHFVPDFFDHVTIPGYDDELKALNKNTLPRYRYLEAKLLCPRCGKEPNLYPEHREYVCENNDSHAEPKGIFVSPFDAPQIISVQDLLKAMVSYSKLSEFINQNLGLTSEDASESLVLQDILDAMTTTDLFSSTLHAMGCDMGIICQIVISRLTLEGTFLVVHRESVHLSEFDKRRRELKVRFNVAVTVCDSQPYIDMILRAQKTDKNLFGAIFVTTKTTEVFKVKMVEGEPEAGKMPIHAVHILKHTALDELLGKFKAKEIRIQQTNDEDLEEEFQKHLLDMKRVQDFDTNNELTYVWEKSAQGIDHFHHALLYSYIACRLRSTIRSTGVTLDGVPLIAKFKVQHKQEEPQRGGSLLIGTSRN